VKSISVIKQTYYWLKRRTVCLWKRPCNGVWEDDWWLRNQALKAFRRSITVTCSRAYPR
jgi:hypothetical protein